MQFFSLTTLLALATTLTLSSPVPLPEDTSPVHPPASLVARATSGDFTWYQPGLGACGTWNTASDLVVALGHDLFDPSTPNGNPNNNKLCGRRIRATYNGKSVDVTVRDRCAGCAAGDLDFSPAAFQKLAALSVGRMKGTWVWL